MINLRNIILSTVIGINCRLDLDALKGTGYQDGSAQISDSGLTIIFDGKMEYDLGKKLIDSGTLMDDEVLPDVTSLPDLSSTPDLSLGCYSNDFNEDTDLENLVFQNGVWSRDTEGYLKQTEGGTGGWRVSYVTDSLFGDLEVSVRTRMYADEDPRVGVVDNHTGILFRYNPIDNTGYVLEVGRSNMDTVQVALSYLEGKELQNVLLDCGEIGCGYGVWRNLRVRAIGSNITAYLNEEELFSVENDLYLSGNIGFACHAFNQSQYDDLEVCPE